jgi:hypothetical protein
MSEKQAYPVDSLGAVDDLLSEELAEEQSIIFRC